MTVLSRISRNYSGARTAEQEGSSASLSPDAFRYFNHLGVITLIVLGLVLGSNQNIVQANTQTEVDIPVIPSSPGVEPISTTERLHQIIPQEYLTAGVNFGGKLHFTGVNVAEIAKTGAMAFLKQVSQEGVYQVKPGIDPVLTKAANEALTISSFSIPLKGTDQLIVLEYASDSEPVYGGKRITKISKYLVGTKKNKEGWKIVFSLPFENLPLSKEDKASGYIPVTGTEAPYYLEWNGKDGVYLIFSTCRSKTNCSLERNSEMVKLNFGQ